MQILTSIPSNRARLRILALLAAFGALALAACDRNQQASAPAVADVGAAAGTGKPAGQPAEDKAGMDHAGMDHAAMGHDMMTPAQMAELREKVPLYAVLSDEQIMENMSRMPPDWWEVLSAKDQQGKIGVLVLGHGYSRGGNEQFKEKLAPIAKEYPTAVAPGMAMMSDAHIQKAVDALTTDHGVETIVALPAEMGDDSSLVHQWQYIFGLRDEAPWLSVGPIETNAKVVFTKSPTRDPLMATIMRDHALEVVKDPATARVILVSHGPEFVEDNPAELALLQAHADRILATSQFKDVKVLSIQDDAVPDVRAANKAELRAMIKEAADEGREVAVVPMILTRGGFHVRLQKDLEGLKYLFADRGLIEHPGFQDWIRSSVNKSAG